MPEFFVSPLAELDVEAVLEWTKDRFGEDVRLRYKALLTRAILDVANNPELPGSHRRREIDSSARTYHVLHSRNHVDPQLRRIRRPRHFLLYRTRADGSVEIGRVLHEAVDLPQHLPAEYRKGYRSSDS
jgi:toxin ParE1/3/4